jgi:hypothetical protein
MGDALELMVGFTADQESIDVAPERRLGRVVGQVHGTPQLTELSAGAMKAGASGGGAEALQQERGRPVAVVDRRRDAQEIMRPTTGLPLMVR